MITMNRQQAVDAVAKASAERDTIQANLLDLDGSFGKRLLTGAQLTGVTKERWDQAAATLASLWETYATYSAVIDRAVALAAGKLGQRELTEISTLLSSPSVEITRALAPLARRDLADTGRDQLTPATAVSHMRRAFAQVTDVVSAAEQAWTAAAGPLNAAAASLARADPLGDPALVAEVAEVRAELDRLRAALNADPLGVALAEASRLRDRAAEVAARTAELAQVRTGAVQRIAALRTAADAVRAACSDAQQARERVAVKIATVPPLPPLSDPAPRLAALDSMLAAGRWTRLSSELDLLERELAAAVDKFHQAERAVVSLLSQRDELRGLLDAYKAKAARLGGAENPGLSRLYDQTRDLLWTAPCDLTAAAAAVTSYQQAVLAIGARR
jgi:chromosome segregation ATPase